MIFLNIGEPDFTAPPLVQEAAQRAMRDGRTQYTQATGLPALRERISALVRAALRRATCRPAPHRRHGRRVGRAAAGLPGAGRGRRRGADARPELPLQPPLRGRRRWPCRCCCRPTADAALPAQRRRRSKRRGAPRTRGVLLASPSNPTGTSIAPDEMAPHRRGRARARRLHAGRRDLPRPELRRALRPQRAGAIGDDVISINSFSKYFSMTGWRLGWLVLPEALVAPVEKLAQNLYICASHGGAARGAGLLRARIDRRVRTPPRRVPARRDFVVPALQRAGPDRAGDARRRVLRLGRLLARTAPAAGISAST